MIIIALSMMVLFGSLVVFSEYFPLLDIDDEPKPAKQVKANIYWTKEDEETERAKYLASGESAFWLNPNRFCPDGGYDLLAEPYREQPKLEPSKRDDDPVLGYMSSATNTQLGNWTYISVGSTSPKTIYRI